MQFNEIADYHEALGKKCSVGLNQLWNTSFQNLRNGVNC